MNGTCEGPLSTGMGNRTLELLDVRTRDGVSYVHETSMFRIRPLPRIFLARTLLLALNMRSGCLRKIEGYGEVEG